MLRAPFRVVLDACVLYPMNLRDVLLQAAAEGLYQVYWSSEILDEAVRNVVKNLQIPEERAKRLLSQMTKAFPEALITGHEPLIPAMMNDTKDRHVAAAAVKAGAQVIVTQNLRDFRQLPEGIEAQDPDDFLCSLLDLDPERMLGALEKICARRKKHPKDVAALVGALQCNEFAGLVVDRLVPPRSVE